MDQKEWREFELLIARVEQALQPSGFVVKSPDKLPDLVTGELREVDASIRNSRLAGMRVVLTIECRDRAAVQDVTWIEQLATKRNDLGIPATLAVSSSGFSAQAVTKAKSHNIELRATKHVTLQDFAEWLKVQSVLFHEHHWWVQDIEVELYDAPPNTQLRDDVIEKINQKQAAARVFVRRSDGAAACLEELLVFWEKLNGNIFRGVPADGKPVRRFISQKVERDVLLIETTAGSQSIKVLNIMLGLRIDKREIPISQLVTYSDAVRPLAELAEWKLADGLVLSLIRDFGKGKIHANFARPGA